MNRVFVPLEIAPTRLPSPSARLVELGGRTMGTTWSVKLYTSPTHSAESLHSGIQAELDDIVSQMSTWEPDSDLSRYNSLIAGWHSVPDAFFEVIATALDVAKQSVGAYDPTVGPLVNLWGFGPDSQREGLPSAAHVEAARTRCGWWRIELDPARRAVLQPGGVYIDLSAIAKGHGVDRVAAYLRKQACESFLVEVGGELVGHGLKPDGQPWWVELEHPVGKAREPLVLALHSLAVATSGDYRRCWFDAAGKRYAHTIDPRTGKPVSHGISSVSVVHKQCMLADALSTALMVMGSTEGMEYAAQHKIAALFIDREGDGYVETMSPALAAMLS